MFLIKIDFDRIKDSLEKLPLKIVLEATATTVEPSKYFKMFGLHEWFRRASAG